jgi:hypothetical protein
MLAPPYAKYARRCTKGQGQWFQVGHRRIFSDGNLLLWPGKKRVLTRSWSTNRIGADDSLSSPGPVERPWLRSQWHQSLARLASAEETADVSATAGLFESHQAISTSLKIGQLDVDLADTLCKQGVSGPLVQAACAQKHTPNLVQREPEALRVLDLRDQLDRLGRVGPVSG